MPTSESQDFLSLLQNTSASKLSSDHLENLKAIAKPVLDQKKVPPDVMRKIILKVCQEEF
ncbi:MAG: hypothetical protein AAGF83_06895 [Cyanobacteria bacterium P01_G01_bin.67]